MDAIRCPGCMRQKTSRPLCEHCGYNENIDNLPHQLPLGTKLRERYEIGKVLGQGGFGITYIGWDHNRQMPVAIKEYYPGSISSRDVGSTHSVFVSSPESKDVYARNKARFLKEAHVLARLNSVPEIVHVHELFEENNTVYMVMEYLKGIDLRRYIRMVGGRLSAELTFAILRPIMTALQKVHGEDLVHRDISPDNIMLMDDGSIKLLDFGAAREVLDADPDRNIVQSTEAILKHGFAPMEQYQRNGTLGPWTDVYALSATIYYCLTGKIPADAPNRIMEGEQIPWDQIPDLTPEQARALDKAMALMPKDRFRNAEELEIALFGGLSQTSGKWKETGIESSEGGTARKKGRKKSSGLWIGIAAAAVAAVAAVAGFLMMKSDTGSAVPAEGVVFESSSHRTIAYEDGSRMEVWQDEANRETGRIFWNADETVARRFVAQYSEAGDLLNQNTYDADWNLLRTEACTYGEDGAVTERKLLQGDGTLIQTTVYDYNAGGKLTGTVTTDAQGRELSRFSWEYREDGTRISGTEAYADGSSVQRIYDSNGNETAAEYRGADGKLLRVMEYTEYQVVVRVPEPRGGVWVGGGGFDSGGGGDKKPSSPIAIAITEPDETEPPTEATEPPPTEPTLPALRDGEMLKWLNTRRQLLGPDGELVCSFEITYDERDMETEAACYDGKGDLQYRIELVYAEEELIARRWYVSGGAESAQEYVHDICGNLLRTIKIADGTIEYEDAEGMFTPSAE